MASTRLPKLNYASKPEIHRSVACVAAKIALTLLFTVVHLWYTHEVAWRLLDRVSRFQSGYHLLNGTDLAPTVPVHLPAGIVLYAAIKLRGLSAYRGDVGISGPTGIILLFAGSIIAGWILASVIAAMLWRQRPIWGHCYWRLWSLLLGWGWILVPAEMSWIYQWAVVY